MLNKTIAGALLMFVGVAGYIWWSTSPSYALSLCTNSNMDEEIECIFAVIEERIDEEGLAEGYEVFTEAYKSLDSFIATGCHIHAHRMGDIAYYRLLRGDPQLESIEFPQETTACGYGFYHGLMEHLIQDNSDPGFVTQTCEYLKDTYRARMKDIGIICYHGSGHGLMLAHAENISPEAYGNIRAFSDVPLAQCEVLEVANTAEIQQCFEGIFNVVVNWMVINQYGFTYNTSRPFSICDAIEKRYQAACILEMAQKLDMLSEKDPKKLERIVSNIQDSQLALRAFKIGISGIVQQDLRTNSYHETLSACEKLTEEFERGCITSIVAGLFAHGLPQEEYIKPLEICSRVFREDNQNGRYCFDEVARKSSTLYAVEKRLDICRTFPDELRDVCAQIATR